MTRTLVQGTKENLVVWLSSKVGDLETLENAQFRVTDKNHNEKVTWATATMLGLQAICPVDTTGWEVGRYKLYLRFQLPNETPVVGPFDFRVDR